MKGNEQSSQLDETSTTLERKTTYSNTESLLVTVRFLSERVDLDDNLFTLLSSRNENAFPANSSGSIIVPDRTLSTSAECRECR